MYPWLRFAKVLLRGVFKRHRLGLGDASVLQFRVWPGDLDFNLHLNDGRTLTLTNFGRNDLVIRLGLFRIARKNGWYPVVASAHVRYRREVRLFQKIRITTRLVGWDEKWFVIHHEIHRAEDLVTSLLLKTAVRRKAGVVPTEEVAAALGVDPASRPLPADVAAWMASEPSQRA